ncbi:MAG: sodium:solute symporter family protein, partial [Armatimonadetes bacterium]|nr:sodium:solute symporter family protein [Armatimonadota bacterium]
MGLAAPASTLWVGIGLYLAAVLAIGLWRAHQARQAEGFFVADRRAGTGLVSASLLATILGASATLGLSSKAWSDGLPAAWWLLSGVLGLLLLAFVFAARVRALGVYTLPEILEVQYGPAARVVASVLIVLSWLGITAGQIVGIQTVLTLGRPEAPLFGVLLATGVVVLYTVVGGQYGLLRTDLWQFWLMLAGFGAALAVCWRQAGGWGGLQASLPPELLRFPANEAMPPGKVMAWLWTVGLPYAMGPDMVSRLLCARDGQTARRAALLTALCLVPLAFVLALLGLAARAA